MSTLLGVSHTPRQMATWPVTRPYIGDGRGGDGRGAPGVKCWPAALRRLSLGGGRPAPEQQRPAAGLPPSACFYPCRSNAEGGEAVDIQVTTAIVAVTVYPDRALVVRQGEAEIPAAGEHTLRLGGLPLSLLRASPRAGGSGPAGARILGAGQAVEVYQAAPGGGAGALGAGVRRAW